jgi:hypothetical protein
VGAAIFVSDHFVDAQKRASQPGLPANAHRDGGNATSMQELPLHAAGPRWVRSRSCCKRTPLPPRRKTGSRRAGKAAGKAFADRGADAPADVLSRRRVDTPLGTHRSEAEAKRAVWLSNHEVVAVVRGAKPEASVSCRIWEGHTDCGIALHCFITRVAVANELDHSQFERELQVKRAPSIEVDRAYDMRMIL